MKRFAVLLVLGLSALIGVTSAAEGREAAVSGRLASGGDQVWLTRYDGQSHGWDTPSMLVASPHGSRVFAVGGGDDGYATVAYSATSGEKLWLRRLAPQWDGYANAVAVSPDGAEVFVTGSDTGFRVATVAYDAATGARLWVSRWQGGGPTGGDSIAVSPDGSRVFVTGGSSNGGEGSTYLTIGYEAATGTRLWVRRYGPPDVVLGGSARSVAVSLDGTRVFVTGSSSVADPASPTGGDTDYATVAYLADTGKTLWVRRYRGPGNSHDSTAAALAVSPDGSSVVVTGRSVNGTGSNSDYATLAYDSATGKTLWARRYDDPVHGIDLASALAFSPDGTQVVVTGESVNGTGSNSDYATIAYVAATGKMRWLSRYEGLWSYASAIGFAPSGTQVYVTGSARTTEQVLDHDYATVAYDASSGAQAWATRYDAGNGDDQANSLSVSPDGTRIYVTGQSRGPGTSYDFATVAYDTG